MKRYLVSTASLPTAVGKNFYDYTGIFEAYNKLDVDGVELAFLPEWDKNHAPLTPTSVDWKNTSRVNVQKLVDLIRDYKISAPIIHINRDVGNMLCSNKKDIVLRGQEILEENLLGAERLNSEIAVFHLWDTYAKEVNLRVLFNKAFEVTKNFEVQIAVENIPISDNDISVVKAWRELDKIMPSHYGFTLDLNWCSLYDNFTELKYFISRLLNVHVQGFVSYSDSNNCNLLPKVGSLDILNCLFQLCEQHYNGFITLEMNRAKGLEDFRKALELIKINSSM